MIQYCKLPESRGGSPVIPNQDLKTRPSWPGYEGNYPYAHNQLMLKQKNSKLHIDTTA